VVMNFASEVGVIFSGRLENHLQHESFVLTPPILNVVPTFDPLVRLCFARYTFPKEPFPINFPKV
jgi:hypothetical protein